MRSTSVKCIQREAASGPPFVGMVRNASHNALHAADHAAGHAAGHAVQNHVLKIMYPDLGMPKPSLHVLNMLTFVRIQ